MTKTILFELLNFGYWSLFGIWCLKFGALFYSNISNLAEQTFNRLLPTVLNTIVAF